MDALVKIDKLMSLYERFELQKEGWGSLKTKTLMSEIEKETLNIVVHFKDMKQFENYNLTYIS